MKLYHIDRAGLLREGQVLTINKNIYLQDEKMQKLLDLSLPYYNSGLSQHGLNYFLYNSFLQNGTMQMSNVIDIIFEYERLLNYPNKLSRYQAFFATDKESIKKMINTIASNGPFYKIYEVEAEYYEMHNMCNVKGGAHYNISAMAKCYWENKNDYVDDVINEYLLKFPVRVIKEVKLNEIFDDKTNE